MLEQISNLSTFAIALAACIHILFFFALRLVAGRARSKIAQQLRQITIELPNRSRLDDHAHLSDQIEGFLADINDVLQMPANSPTRRDLLSRLKILDERREYLQSLRFEIGWNVARNMIEAYPLAGVLGTICAIGAALAGENGGTVAAIVGRFGDAIWSTFAGLVAAIILMLINSLVEPGFARLAENRRLARDTISRAKRELNVTADQGETNASSHRLVAEQSV